MASERAKKLAAEQKAAIKAEKLRKKNSEDPEDWGRGRQFLEAFKITKENDKLAVPFMIGGFLLALAVGIGLSFFLKPWWLWIVFGLLFGLLVPMYVLTWRFKGAMYKSVEGKPGAGQVALNSLSKKWIKDPIISVDRHQNLVHRAVGPAGIVLVGEGQPGRVREMLATETKRHEAIKYSVPVTSLLIGEAKNQVPLKDVTRHIKKLPKVIKGSQVTEISARLKALDGSGPRLPIPKGPMPSMKGGRAALRGR